MLMLAGCFLWPVWARAHTRSAKERQQMAERFAREIIRMCLHGTLRPEKYAELDAALGKEKNVVIAESPSVTNPRCSLPGIDDL